MVAVFTFTNLIGGDTVSVTEKEAVCGDFCSWCGYCISCLEAAPAVHNNVQHAHYLSRVQERE